VDSMLKISFWLKKIDGKESNLENVIIDSPKKVLEGELMGTYSCEVYLPIPAMERKKHIIYSSNPIDTLCLTSEFVKSQLQFLINRGYTVSEMESGENP